MAACARCGAKQGFLDVLGADLASGEYLCSDCKDKAARIERKRVYAIEQIATDVIVTTTPSIYGKKILQYLGIESIEYVIGTAIFSEFSSSVADIFGRRSTAFEKKLHEAKRVTMNALKYRAAEMGGNAVIGVDMDYAEFSGNRVALILNGTVVELDSKPSEEATETVEVAPETEEYVEPLPTAHDSPKSTSVPVECRGCLRRFKAPSTAAGKTVKCPGCKRPIAIPLVSA